MPRRKTLNPRTERQRRQQTASLETPSLREQRLVTLRSRVRGPLIEVNAQQIHHRQRQEIFMENRTINHQMFTSTPPDRIRAAVNRKRMEANLPITFCYGRLLKNDSEVEGIMIGNLDQKCRYCQAKLFSGEVVDCTSSICCHKGKINLPPITCCEDLRLLIERNDVKTKRYLHNIRQFNNALAFASIQVDKLDLPGRGPFCFKVHGQVYHFVGSLHPPSGLNPSYASLFILDSSEALALRTEHVANKECDRDIMEALQKMIEENNPYAQLFKFVKDIPCEELQLKFKVDNAFDKKRYNLPNAHEIAAVFVSNDGAPPGRFDFTIHSKGTGTLTRISYLNPHCDPLCYPLLFPCGDSGWKPGMSHVNILSTEKRHVMTQLQYCCYRLAVRDGFSLLHASGRLFQQYVVDSYVKVEGSRIAFIRSHQKELRAESYKGLIDFFNTTAQDQGLLAGVPVILPSTFIGSPRNMLQNYQDSMSIVGRFGKPDIFLTFTCNPRWREISEQIKPYEQVENRPDLVSRVFYLKLKALLNDLNKRHIFGVVKAFVEVIEFQKRGLPHAHMLIILQEGDKIREVEEVDSMVSAEIPDESQNPRLYNIVKQCMVHGPCGHLNSSSPCMQDGKCSKKYPKEFVDETALNVNGYPLYRRRQDGRMIRAGQFEVDNRWIVPYNPYLSLKYEAHINVEICSSVKSVKYLYKYIYKGHDCTSLQLQTMAEGEQRVIIDEINVFLNCRYVSPPEACWRLLERPLFNRLHTVVRLPVHLQDEQTIYFQNSIDQQQILEKDTQLTAFFKLCQRDETARQFLYHEIPEHYIWKQNQWLPRKKFSNCLARMYTVSPKETERYFLRLLLLHKRGVTGYEDIKTVDEAVCESFAVAAQKLHLVENDQEWFHCLQESSQFRMPSQMRDLFTTICLFCSPVNVTNLWNFFKEALSEDFLRNHDRETSFNMSLCYMDEIFQQHGKLCKDFLLPSPTLQTEMVNLNYNHAEEKAKGFAAYAKLNMEQRTIADEILASIRCNTQKLLFIDGPGGTGKTFLYKTLAHILRGEGKIVLPVAYTGIAANLLEGGTTSHSLFKIPVPLLETSVSTIRPHSRDGQNLRQASVIIWDEVSMVPKNALPIVDRLLRDVTSNDAPFGGKTIIFGGDFRQILPVVRHGNRTTIVESRVKKSPLWQLVENRHLRINMRANEDLGFSNWLIQLGNGTLEVQNEISETTIKIPKQCYCSSNQFVQKVFDATVIYGHNINDFYNRAILCPKNDDCQKINDDIVQNIVEEQAQSISVQIL